MKTNRFAILGLLLAAAASTWALQSTRSTIAGDYLEVRSCDVYTGSCFANAEMGLSGRECMMVWSVNQGSWRNVDLDGLKVIAVVRVNDTLGDLRYHPRQGKAVLVVDANATSQQKEALTDMARQLSNGLIHEVARVETAPIQSSIGVCHNAGCAKVQAGRLVAISTRCFGDKDHVCGNEETYYPPLTQIDNALPAFTELAAFQGQGLNLTWESTGQRSAFLGTFTR